WQLWQLIQRSCESLASWNRSSPRSAALNSPAGPSAISAVTRPLSRSTTDTESACVLATNARLPSGLTATAVGRRPRASPPPPAPGPAAAPPRAPAARPPPRPPPPRPARGVAPAVANVAEGVQSRVRQQVGLRVEDGRQGELAQVVSDEIAPVDVVA